MIFIRLFGGASIVQNGTILGGPAAQRHRLALLSLLCISHPRPLSRDKLLGYLWPERDNGHARNLLKQAVHVLRKALGDTAIVSAGDDLQLGSPAPDCDLLAFEEAVAAEDWVRADQLYSGPLLDGFFLDDATGFDQWLAQERERLRRDWRRALAALAEQQFASGDIDAARASWQRLLADDPHDGRATVGLMESLEALGDRGGALRQADLHVLLLQEDFGAGPDPLVRAAAERVREGRGSADSARQPARRETTEGAATSGTPDGAGRAAGDLTVRAANGSWWSGRRVAALGAVVLLMGALAWVSARALSDDSTAITSIAVLPLANLTGDPGQDYFVGGMHDALISELAQIEALTVFSRQSVLGYQDSDLPLPRVAEELGADAIVEGTVFKSGDSVRISVQVVQARPERHLIAETFTGPLNRALALQGEVARTVAGAMRARVTPAVQERLTHQRAVDPAAQDAYLAGLYHLERASYGQILPSAERLVEIRRAIASLENAVGLDSTWAAAFAKLALASHWMASYWQEDSDEYFRRSKAAAHRALALDSTESQAWASLGFGRFVHDWDWAGAEAAIRRAIELEPNSHHWIYALYLRAAGRHDESIAEFLKAEARDPLSDALKAQVAFEYACAGRHDEAITQARALNTRVTAAGGEGVLGDSTWLLTFMAEQYSLAGQHAEAIAAAKRLLARTDTVSAGPLLAVTLAMGGQQVEARQLVRRLEEMKPGGYHWQASIYAALGDTGRAVAATARAIQAEGRGVIGVRCWMIYRMLPDEPRLQELLKPVNFPN